MDSWLLLFQKYKRQYHFLSTKYLKNYIKGHYCLTNTPLS